MNAMAWVVHVRLHETVGAQDARTSAILTLEYGQRTWSASTQASGTRVARSLSPPAVSTKNFEEVLLLSTFHPFVDELLNSWSVINEENIVLIATYGCILTFPFGFASGRAGRIRSWSGFEKTRKVVDV
jgi:hypothetical protein